MKNLSTIFAVLFVLTTNLLTAQTNVAVLTMSITCPEDNNILQWSTQKEVNSSYFLIESSLDNQNFTIIGRLSACGYSLNKKDYEFEITDEKAGPFYRIALVSMDGARETSIALSTIVSDPTNLLVGK